MSCVDGQRYNKMVARVGEGPPSPAGLIKTTFHRHVDALLSRSHTSPSIRLSMGISNNGGGAVKKGGYDFLFLSLIQTHIHSHIYTHMHTHTHTPSHTWKHTQTCIPRNTKKISLWAMQRITYSIGCNKSPATHFFFDKIFIFNWNNLKLKY